jgi:hypothetical protein
MLMKRRNHTDLHEQEPILKETASALLMLLMLEIYIKIKEREERKNLIKNMKRGCEKDSSNDDKKNL